MSKVALITGGASGIGLATGRLFASKGWTVAIADLNVADGEKYADELKGSFHKTNVTDYDNLAQTFAHVWNKYGRLDMVYANAGIVEKVNFYEAYESDKDGLPPRLDDRVLDINLKSVVSTAHLALHFFRKNKVVGGNLVVTASTGGLFATPLLPMYAAAKHGCVGFVRSLAETLDGSGIRVNCVCPGAVATGLLKKEEWGKFPQDTFTPVENVAKAVAQLVEDETLTGKALMIVQDRFTIFDSPPPSDPALLDMMSKNNKFKDGIGM